MPKKTLLIVLAILILAGGAYYYQTKLRDSFEFTAGPIVSSAHYPGLPGRYLADKDGRALYTFADDQDLKSVCIDECAEKWPVFEYNNQNPSQYSDGLSKRLNIIKRPDGYLQFAYGLQPLYYYAGDLRPGKTNGQGLNEGKWTLVPLD